MTASWSDLALAMLAGMLTGFLLRGRRLVQRHERPIARLVSAVLEPIYYWSDLKGTDGRPSHSKVAYFLGLLTSLAVLILFALHEREHTRTGDPASRDIGLGFIAYAALVLAYALGKQVFNGVLIFLAGKFPGLQQHPRLSGAQVAPVEPPPGGAP